MLIHSKYILYSITLKKKPSSAMLKKKKKKNWLYYLEQDRVKFGTDMSKT